MTTQTDIPSSSPGHPGGTGAEFFDRIRSLGIVRPDQGRWAAGVARGLADRWGVDPILVRGGFVALTLIGGAGPLLYGLCWLFLPHPDGRIHAQEVLQGRVTAGFVGAVLVTLGNISTGSQRLGVIDSGPWFWQPLGTNLVSLAVVGGVVWWFVAHRDRLPWNQDGEAGSASGSASSPSSGYAPNAGSGYAPEPGAPTAAPLPLLVGRGNPARSRDLHAPSSAITRATLGLATVLAVTLVLVAGNRLAVYTWVAAAATALGVVGLGLVVAGLTGRRGGGLVPIAIILGLVSLNGAALRPGLGTAGQEHWTPTATSTATRTTYQLGAGQAVLDLTDPSLTATGPPVTLTTDLGAGELQIVIPKGASIEVDAQVGVGEVDDTVAGQVRGGVGDQLTHSGGAAPILLVKAQVGLGRIVILPQGSPEVAR